MSLKNKILSEGATERFAENTLPKTLTPETKLRRRELAAALTQQGFPMAPSTLASMGSRGTGPERQLRGRIPIYTLGPEFGLGAQAPKARSLFIRRHTMKRRGPPNGSGPRSEKKMRVAAERSHNRSDYRRASSPKPHLIEIKVIDPGTAPETLLTSPAPTIVLKARGRSRFDVSLDETLIVKSSAQPICDAARVLHRRGYSDDRRLTVWHEGADHHAISGSLGYWRKQRIREDRGIPRYVAWEPRPRRVGAKKGRRKVKGAEDRAEKKNTSTTTPGAGKGQSAVLRPPPRPLPGQP